MTEIKFNFHFTSNYAYFSPRPCCVVKYSRSYDFFEFGCIFRHVMPCGKSTYLQFCSFVMPSRSIPPRTKPEDQNARIWGTSRPLRETFEVFDALWQHMVCLFQMIWSFYFFLSHRIEKIMIHEINFGTM